MRARGVVVKLFAVTSVFILIVFTLGMLLEGLFFERFYRSSKIQDLSGGMREVAKQLQQGSVGELELSRLLGSFMNEYDASTAILSQDLTRISVNPYFIQLQTAGKKVTVVFPTEGMPAGGIRASVKTGDNMTIDGIFMDEQDTVLHPVDFQPTGAEPGEGLVRVSGRVTDLLLPQQRSFNPYYQDALIDGALKELAVPDGLKQKLQADGQLKQQWTDAWSGVQYAMLIQPLPVQGIQEGGRYLFAMTSLQPVGEAVGTLKKYFIYAGPALLLLAVLLSLIYSRLVSRPLVQLNKLSSKLAKLDFSAQPEIRSRDEFGELSRNLLSLSRHLDATLRELSDANAKLQQDVEEKERTEELRKELIANLSHELKTPLGIVKGFAEGLQDSVAEDKRERYLGLIVNETDRMNALILDMLELSKYELKAVRLNPEVIPLVPFLQTLAGSFTQQMEKKGLTFRLDGVGGQALYVKGDRRKLEQVVLNLLSNAVRHASPNGLIRIRVKPSLLAEAEPLGRKGSLTVWIENTGSPIAQPDMERIWEHFYRAERSRDRKSGGTGLGLAIVKHILELHGSRYGAVNTADGVAFYFTLEELDEIELKGDLYHEEDNE